MNIVHVIKGLFIGIALVVPGLSASIFAVVVGLYDEILFAARDVAKSPKKSTVFLSPILIGVLAGILISMKAVLWICQTYTVQSYSFFIGLVLGSIPFILEKMFRIQYKPYYILVSVGACLVLLAMSTLAIGTEEAKSYIDITGLRSARDCITMVFAGAFSCSIMAVPGVDGSIMLMVINQYSNVVILLPFVIGGMVGFAAIVKVLSSIINKFESIVYYGISGLVAATVIILFHGGIIPYLNLDSGFSANTSAFLWVGIFGTIGFVCTILLNKAKG